MPATEQTKYNIKLLHVIFAVTGLTLLVSTLWMLKADHEREWKQYQRKARAIDLRMTDWRLLKQQTDAVAQQQKSIQDRLDAARKVPLDEELLAAFLGADETIKDLGDVPKSRDEKISFLGRIIRDFQSAEDKSLGSLKFSRANLDKAKADLGLAVRDGLGKVRQDELQLEINDKQATVDDKTKEYDLAKDVRQRLQNILAELTAEERGLEKELADSKAELERLTGSIVDRQSKWFEGNWLGKRWLELPILDAFNSPLKIENLWSEDLEQDYNHRMVRRFDRCTTCHQAMEKTLPGMASEEAYVRERIVQLRLSTPELEKIKAAEAGLAPEAGDAGAGESEPSVEKNKLLEQYGIQLAEAGLLNRGEVTIQFVEPYSLGATAEALADIPVTENQLAEDIVKSLLESPGLAGVDLFTQTHVNTRPGFQLGDVLLAINKDPVESRGSSLRTKQAAVYRLLDLASRGEVIEITVRRGLPHPFSGHPRLDLFVGSLSPHKMSQFACTVCHEGQGSATTFKWASHTPDSLGDRGDWMTEHGWFDNHHWVYPMHPKRFMESSCLKCHHDVTELQQSEKFPEPPAPKLTKGHSLIRKYGCFGCHEINGYEGPDKRIGPDMRLEPNFFAAALALKADEGFSKLPAEEQGLIEQLINHPEEDDVRHRISAILVTDEVRQENAQADDAEQPVFDPRFRGKMAALLKDVTPAGTLRKPGPSLRFVGKKAGGDFLYDWIREPGNFRPSTRMPRFFGLWSHLGDDADHSEKSADAKAEDSDNRHRDLEPVEIQSMVAYLQDRSQEFEYLEPPKGISESTKEQRVTRGKALFQERGCLACHSHQDFPEMEEYRDPQQSVQGPDLSNLAGKFGNGNPGGYGSHRNSKGPRWLYSWIKEPTRYHARTVMPDLFLGPIEKKDAKGKVLEVTDPVADIVEYLLSGQPHYKPSVEKVQSEQINALLEVYLEDGYAVAKDDIMKRGFAPARAARLQGHERELGVSQADYDAEKPLSDAQKLRYLGRKSIAKYGCYGCHDIPGFEDAKPIGTGLADWGRKDPGKLAFEHINEFLAGHGHGGHGHGDDGHDHHGHDDHEGDASDHGDSAEADHAAGDHVRGSDYDDQIPDFYEHQLHSHNRTGFIYQKLRQPRSYDYHKTKNKTYNERLRMPRFPFSTEDREAVITFVLGLVADSPREKYVYRPDPRQQAVEAGLRVMDKFNCKGCHLVTPETWDLAFPKDSYAAQPSAQASEQSFAFQRPVFSHDQIAQSSAVDAQGLQHARVHGLPNLGELGWPIVMEKSEGEMLGADPDLMEEEFSTSSLDVYMNLWKPTLLGGNVYETGINTIGVAAEYVKSRSAAGGGDLAKYLLPHAVDKYRKLAQETGQKIEVTKWGYLPPPLIGEGAKVQTSWLHEFLLDPYPIRPSVILRMPRFNMSAEEAAKLVNYFAAIDNVDYPYSFVQRRRTAHLESQDAIYRKLLRDQHATEAEPGRRLADAMKVVLDKENCVACHIVGDFVPTRPDPAPNLAQVYRRLRPDYVRNWVAKPKAVLPYTNMPIVFKSNPEDKQFGGGVKQDLYHGKRLEQLDAVVDLLMNYDWYVKQRANIRSMVKIEAPATEESAEPVKEPADADGGN